MTPREQVVFDQWFRAVSMSGFSLVPGLFGVPRPDEPRRGLWNVRHLTMSIKILATAVLVRPFYFTIALVANDVWRSQHGELDLFRKYM